MLNTFVVYVEDKPGVLARVAILFRRRAFNIETLTVGHSETPGISRMTIVVDTDQQGARRIEATLYKLVNVLWVQNVTGSCVYRDLALLKVGIPGKGRAALLELAGKHGAQLLEETADAMLFEITGGEEQIDEFVKGLRTYRVIEMVHTGRVAMTHCGQTSSFKKLTHAPAGQVENDIQGLCCR